MIKVGLIGLGYMGGTHAAAYGQLLQKLNFRVTAVADLDQSKADKTAAQFGAAAYYSGDELLKRGDVNVVDICLPTYLHYEYAEKAIGKGLHVFVEKPLCLNSDEAKKLTGYAKQKKVYAQVGQCIRFWDEYEYLKKVYDNKEFGKVLHAKFRRLSPRPTWGWQNWLMDEKKSGGAMLDLHVHDADYMLYLFGKPKKMKAFPNVSGEKWSSVTACCDYGDFSVILEGSWDYPSSFPFEMSYIAAFERATVIFSSNHGVKVCPAGGEAYTPAIQKACAASSGVTGGNISDLGGYYNELYYFLDCLSKKKKPARAPLSAGTEAVKFVEKEKK
ncbi:hypothetical protein FACS1894211_00150 [Clostridia bacterium]|nr:hypothetical protein FACS1894211_00150 [Clostridia bacterium]